MRAGVRLQILIALGVLLAVAFVPLYFAVARLTQASLAAARRDAADELGRAVAGHVLAEGAKRTRAELADLLDAQVTEDGVATVAFVPPGGERVVAGEATLIPEAPVLTRESSQVIGSARGPALLVIVPGAPGRGAALVVVPLESGGSEGAALVRLVALYTAVVAVALLFFAYAAMTRLVVKPIEDVSRAAGRVASGHRSFELRGQAPREISQLAESLRAMTERLMQEEEALRAKVDELERTARELKAAQETVVRSERLASVGRLAAGVAHEIGNPIAALLGFEELLLSGDLSKEEERDFLRRMQKETERVSRVLRDLLDFARPGSASTEAVGAADVAEVAAGVRALLSPQKSLQKIDLQLAIPDELPLAGIASERLSQLLLNLLLNAADAARSVVALACREQAGKLVLTIEDDGPGIAASVRGRIFEPFVTTKEVGKGTGLGLAVCRGLVEAVGGTIRVADGQLGGACFVVELPIASAGVSPA